MRVLFRVALVVVLLAAPALLADHFTPECQLSLVAQNNPATNFGLSPHGVFRNGNLVHVLRGQTLTTYTVTDLGDMQIAREDFIGSLAARETNGGVTFGNGYLFVSSEAGLEIYDLRNVRAGGNAPILVSRTAGFHYRRLAVNGSTLAGLYPIQDLPCQPIGLPGCANTVDLFNITSLTAPVRVGQISTAARLFLGFNDIAFNYGFLVATGPGGTYSFNVTNPSLPSLVGTAPSLGTFLVSNGANLLGVGDPGTILVYGFGTNGLFTPVFTYNVAPYLTIDRSNPIAFHPQAWFDDPNGRLITMVDEIDRLTLKPARTIAFDVFDFTTPMYEGSAERPYEEVTMVTGPDEVKHNPVTVGSNVYVVGEMSGAQTWGSCNVASGRIELDNVAQLSCGGTELHGFVTGTQKIANVELFLDNGALGFATLSPVPRTDVASRTPVSGWRLSVNLDATARGEHVLRAVATDALGTRRQFSSVRLFFPGPGANCTSRRRAITGR